MSNRDALAEKIRKGLNEKQQAVVEAQNHKTDLRWDDLVKDFSTELNQLVELQVQEKLDKLPNRRQPGEAQGIYDDAAQNLKDNRYQRIVKNIARDGYHQVAGDKRVKSQDFFLAKKFLDAQQASGWGSGPSEDFLKAYKALDTGSTGFGAELVRDANADFLWQDFYAATVIAPNMDNSFNPMPADPFDIPNDFGDFTWRKATQNVAVTATNLATDDSQLKTTELVTQANWSYSVEEDAVVAMMPAVRARLAISGGKIIDDFILNADGTAAATGNINSDDSAPASDSYYLSAGDDGLRHFWLVDNTGQGVNAGGDALTDTDMADLFAAMGKYALDLNGTCIVADVATYLAGLRTLDSVLTVDKYGPQATVLTGELARYSGIPVFPSNEYRLAEADGKRSATAANNTLGSVTGFHKAMWYIGFKRDTPMVEVDRDIQRRMHILVASMRIAVTAHGDRTSDKHTAGIRNILV